MRALPRGAGPVAGPGQTPGGKPRRPLGAKPRAARLPPAGPPWGAGAPERPQPSPAFWQRVWRCVFNGVK